jgi:hypothetical protein
VGDLSWEAILCAAIPFAIVVAILVRAVRRAIRRRGAPTAPLNTKDSHIEAFDLGRQPVDPDRWFPGP